MGIFQFVVLSNLRAAQLMRGCIPRVDGVHKHTVIAQLEVSAGKVVQSVYVPKANGAPVSIADPLEPMLAAMAAE
jgi:DNA-directed RNA polymerase subunit K/omega